MNRCSPVQPSHAIPRLLAALCAVALLAGAPAAAQNTAQGSMGAARPFPEAALRGTLVVLPSGSAEIDGRPVRLAPGLRLFSPQNTLVLAHNVVGKPLTVNYVIESSTGMLLTAWILTGAEAAVPRAGSGTERNYRFASEAPTR